MKKLIAILMVVCSISIGAEYEDEVVEEQVSSEEAVETEEPELVISKYIQDSESYHLLKDNKVDVENIYYVANSCYQNTPDTKEFVKLDSDMMYAHSEAEINLETDLVKALETSLSTLVAYSFLDLYLKK